MKTLIAIPCMDQVAAPFSQSLAMLRKVGECYVCHLAGSLVYDSRNKLVAKAVELGCDYVMWFDSDMVFEPDTMERLMAHDKDIVSGVYFRRTGSYKPVLLKELRLNEDGTAVAVDYIDYPKNELFTAEGIGFGCVLVKTKVFYEMALKFQDFFTPIGKCGEDLSFCLRARELGFDINVDPTIRLGHVGNVIVTERFYEAYKSAEGAHNVQS